MTGPQMQTVTFLVTDIEHSTRLWEERPEWMREALARHDSLLQAAVDAHGGRVFKRLADGLFAAFDSATSAIFAAAQARDAIHHENWGAGGPLHIRIAVHTGEAESRGGDYFGGALSRCARLKAVAHGGQVLLTEATAQLTRDSLPDGCSLRPLGPHRLRDLQRPMEVYQLIQPGLPEQFPTLRSLDTFPHNLPVQLTPFIGRESEIEAVTAMLADTDARLVTLTGTGGSGKTRLALQVAARLVEQERFPGGVWFVSLAEVTEAERAPSHIAAVLGLHVPPGGDSFGPIINLLQAGGAQPILLVLDNLEHIMPVGSAVAGLLRAASNLRILATSRQGLRIQAEHEVAVGSLTIPSSTAPLEDISRAESVRLFVDRARVARMDFVVDDSNASLVSEICTRLDGIPMAIELAAARVRGMTLRELCHHLSDRPFQVLASVRRDGPRRQRTLLETMTWSFDLLSPAEQQVFMQAGVFHGGFFLEAAEAVCESDGEPLSEIIFRLSEQSLLSVNEERSQMRFFMLQVVREYALERLAESSERVDRARQRHAEYHASVAESLDSRLRSGDYDATLAEAALEAYNLRGALQWACNAQDHAVAARLGHAMGLLCINLGMWSEYMARAPAILRAMRMVGNRRGEARLLEVTADIASRRGEWKQAYDSNLRAYEIAVEIGDPRLWAKQANLAWYASHIGAHDEALARSKEGLRLAREHGDDETAGFSLLVQSEVALARGNADMAVDLAAEAKTCFDRIHDRGGIVTSLERLADAARARGDFDTARRNLQEALRLRRQDRNRYNLIDSLLRIAALYGDRDPELAVEALTITAALQREAGSVHIERTERALQALHAESKIGAGTNGHRDPSGAGSVSLEQSLDMIIARMDSAPVP